MMQGRSIPPALRTRSPVGLPVATPRQMVNASQTHENWVFMIRTKKNASLSRNGNKSEYSKRCEGWPDDVKAEGTRLLFNLYHLLPRKIFWVVVEDANYEQTTQA